MHATRHGKSDVWLTALLACMRIQRPCIMTEFTLSKAIDVQVDCLC